MSTLRGSCHCGQLRLELDSARPPEDLPVRECQCSFCVRHAALYTSDPTGQARFLVAEPAELSRYRFAMMSADFLLCRRCGVYVGAFMPDEGLAVLNLRVLDERARFTGAPARMDYDAEDLAARLARRRQRWTPATLA